MLIHKIIGSCNNIMLGWNIKIFISLISLSIIFETDKDNIEIGVKINY